MTNGTSCAVEVCDRLPRKKGMCNAHYDYFRRTGVMPTHKVAPFGDYQALFWSKVDQSGGPDACWVWMAALDRYGYGTFHIEGRKWVAHRASLWLRGTVLNPNLQVDHLCRNKACVNPAHLEQVTQTENNRRTRGFRPVKTHCKNGHLFDEANTYWPPKGARQCRACVKARSVRWRANKKARIGGE